MAISDWSATESENKTVPGSPTIEIGKANNSPQGHNIQTLAIQRIMAEIKASGLEYITATQDVDLDTMETQAANGQTAYGWGDHASAGYATLTGSETLTNKTLPAPILSTTLFLTGVISPSQITSSQNDYNPTGLSTASVLRLDSSSAWTISGLAGGSAGRIVTLHNIGWNDIYLSDEDASSTAANRFITLGGQWTTLKSGGSVMLQYDGTSSRWRVITNAVHAASQANMEAGTSSAVGVTPANFHYHPAAAKCWGQTTGGATPTLTTSYNVTSITDTAVGRLTVTIANDFSSADWAGVATPVCATNANRMCSLVSKAAGSVIIETSSAAATLADPGTGWDWAFYGDL